MKFAPLGREEVRRVIAGKGEASRVPVLLHLWTDADTFGDRAREAHELLAQYPQDAQLVGFRMPDTHVGPPDDPEYRWVNYADPTPEHDSSFDEKVAIDEWSRLDGVLETFPKASYPGLLPHIPEPDGRYRLGHWWFWLFERHWSLRGMTNALTDYMLYPEETHRLFRALTDFYIGVIERAHAETGLDGIFTSDDLGTQRGPFFSTSVFREFYKPYYREVVARTHELGMQFWLHACGNIEPFLPDLIEIGLDAIHPIQKYTMDEATIARRYGKDICIWGGFDVQQTIPWGTPDDVRREVRFMMDTYRRPEGRFMFTAGNAIKGDCPMGSLEALYDEAFGYGSRSLAVKGFGT